MRTRLFFSKAHQTMKSNTAHLTDLEGNWNYLTNWAKRSKLIQLNDHKLSFRKPGHGHQFVYGGDLCDKGPGDLRIGQLLLDFKYSKPNNVHLIAGNREIKCRRFTYELNANIKKRLLTGPAAFWNKTKSPFHYVIEQMRYESKQNQSPRDMALFLESKSIIECQTLYLKWMLNETMGCGAMNNKPSTFEFRRQELALINGVALQAIDDFMVTQSFIDSVSPNGVITQYLKESQLGVVIDDTLFIHGAVTLENLGYLPGMNDSSLRMTNAREWISALNDWYKAQISQWIKHPIEEELLAPGHHALDQYVLFNPKSVITTNWYQHGKLAPIPDKVVQFLNKAGIYRVISGHQPFSDFPLIIRQANLEVIVGDTGYSDPGAANDNRGAASHNLELTHGGDKSFVTIDAIKRDGVEIHMGLPSRQQIKSNKDAPIGHFTETGELIRPLDDKLLVASQLNGYEVEDKVIIPSASNLATYRPQ